MLSALIAEIEAEAYVRGRADARKEVLSALNAPGQPALMSGSRREKPRSTRSARKRRTAGGKRAPRGSVRTLVERALRAEPGLSAWGVLDRADSDAERLIKLGSIRVELQTGRRQGRYETKGAYIDYLTADRRTRVGASNAALLRRAREPPASPRHGRRRPTIHDLFFVSSAAKTRGWSAFADHDGEERRATNRIRPALPGTSVGLAPVK